MSDLKLIKYRKIALLALAHLILLSGCTSSKAAMQVPDEKNIDLQSVESIINDDVATQIGQDNVENGTEEKITLDTLPNYSGEAYVELNGNIPDFSNRQKKSLEPFEIYAELDAYGRCGQAYANICPDLMPTEERENIGQIKPSGWHTIKYSELIEDKYLYNRCHLIAYQLAGENANEKNLITGTRYLNTEGMLPFEDTVKQYVDLTENHVLYRATPVFEGENLVASGVELEAWSVEDDGKGICFNVFCYNVQPGIEIDYATGASRIAEDGLSEITDTNSLTEERETQDNGIHTESPEESEIREYVLNIKTNRIHLPECSSVDDMAEHNRRNYTGTISELIEDGYTPCGRCLAEYR